VQLACWHRHARSAIVPPLAVGLLSLDVCIYCLGDGLVRAIIKLVFRCKITGGGLATNDEASGFRWATEPGARPNGRAYAIRLEPLAGQLTAGAVRSFGG
jgi:hypothetical protein